METGSVRFPVLYLGIPLSSLRLRVVPIPESVILEGMFMINTKPLRNHKVISDYGTFLMRRFILPYFPIFEKGVKKRQKKNHKEQLRHDVSLPDHICFTC